MSSQQPVVMYCPSCGSGVRDDSDKFMIEYLCPECGGAGYFRHEPLHHEPLYQEDSSTAAAYPHMQQPVGGQSAGQPFQQPGLAQMQSSAMPTGPESLPAQFAGAAGMVLSAPAKSSSWLWKTAAALVVAAGVGGASGWYYNVTVQAEKQAQQEEAKRRAQLEAEFQGKLLNALAIKDLHERAQALTALRTSLAGSGLAAEKAVTDALVVTLVNTGAAKSEEAAEKEKRAAFLAAEAAKTEELARKAAQDAEKRAAELAAKEAEAAKVIEQQKVLAEKEKEHAQKEQKLKEYEQRMQTLEGKLTQQVEKINQKETALQQQQEQINQAAAQAQAQAQAAAQAQAQAAAAQAARPTIVTTTSSPQVVVVEKEVPSGFIIERSSYPVVISNWDWRWGPRPPSYWPGSHHRSSPHGPPGLPPGSKGISINIRR